MSTVQQVAARLSRQAAAGLAGTVKAMPPEKQTWAPEGGRTALSQLQECAATAPWFTGMLRDRAPVDAGGEYGRIVAELDTVEKALAGLAKGTEAMAAAIEAFPTEHLADQIALPWGEATFEDLLFMGYWNMVYHQGQVNYIQTLYGDQEMHGA